MEFLRTLEALRLLRVGGITTNRYSMHSRHVFVGGILGGGSSYSRYNYTLAGSDSTSLKGFLHDVVPLISLL